MREIATMRYRPAEPRTTSAVRTSVRGLRFCPQTTAAGTPGTPCARGALRCGQTSAARASLGTPASTATSCARGAVSAILSAVLKALQVLLTVLVPLLERRILAAERQAAAAEDLAGTVRTYLGYTDPQFAELLQGRGPAVQSAEEPADEYSEHGDARDVKAERLEQLRTFWFHEHGELLDDERLVAEYERLYAEAEARQVPRVQVPQLDARFDPSQDGPGVAH